MALTMMESSVAAQVAPRTPFARQAVFTHDSAPRELSLMLLQAKKLCRIAILAQQDRFVHVTA
jgi:hypothetical protein